MTPSSEQPAGWILTPDDLDRLPQLHAGPANDDPPEGRYRPAGDHWPQEGVTLSYAELRRLIAMHLDAAWQGMPNQQPWGWVKARAHAMREGETPLLISEVLE